MEIDNIYCGDCTQLIKEIDNNSIDLILSDIPYGISVENWDVLHNNTNSALLGTSPAQIQAGKIFQKRGKPLNGWSEADKKIPVEYYNWVRSWVDDWLRVTKPGGSVFVFAGRRLAHRCICAFEDAGFIYKDMIGWDKQKAAHRAQHISCVFDRRKDYLTSEKWEGWKVGNLRPVFEPILWFMKPYKIGGTLADNVLEYEVGAYNETILDKYNQKTNNLFFIESQNSDKGLHPTQKPLKLMELLIELTTTKAQIVLDPFAGSATTLVAAYNLDRHFIGFEKSKEYYDIAKQRIDNLQNSQMQQSLCL
ncbi:MAG: site-specific DNA-methyltransferase [Cyanobacteria bacterium SIG32]|nr:site-specific DNA-methyltransferase [Cyanobacteria bacterium SIG32]